MALALEPFAPADLAWLKKMTRAAEEPTPVVREVRLDASGGCRRDWSERASEDIPYSTLVTGDRVTIREHINPQPQAFWLFGAGHVGRAVAYAIAAAAVMSYKFRGGTWKSIKL